MVQTLKEIYNVQDFISEDTGLIVREFWLLNSKTHSLNDRPAIVQYDDAGRVTEKIWMKYGNIHREGAPAWVKIDPETNVIYQESWMREGGHFREGREPAYIERDRITGQVTAQKRLMENGKMGRFRNSRSPEPHGGS